jgi:DNA polymerase-1
LDPDPLLVADVPWLLYRAFFALPKAIVGAEGQPVNALLGTVNALLAAIEACSPRAVVACLGAEQAAYRVALYAPYHAHRDPMPEQLRWQWQRAPELLESLGWTVSSSDELEADDVMFSFARAEAAAGGRTLILSGDRDMFQAVDERTAILELPKRGGQTKPGQERVEPQGNPVEAGPEHVRERYGIGPVLVPDFIALRGDPSDGLPGAPGVGAKTAAELLLAHGSLEDLLAACEHSDPRLRPRKAATLLAHAPQLRTFKEIATLVEISVQLPARHSTNFAQGARVAREMGMDRLAARLDSLAGRAD